MTLTPCPSPLEGEGKRERGSGIEGNKGIAPFEKGGREGIFK